MASGAIVRTNPREKRRVMYGLAGAGVALLSFAVSTNIWQGALGGVLGLLMLAIAWTDSHRFVVPDALSYGAVALGLINGAAFSPEGGFEGALEASLHAVLSAALFFIIRLVYRRIRKREGLGLGDVKLAAVAGAWLSLLMLPFAVEIAALTGLSTYLWRQRSRGRALRSTSRLPFGAFFALAIWFGWVSDTYFVISG
jgi:leader peptidase (prepilin peptidase)/N-methyltransferase